MKIYLIISLIILTVLGVGGSFVLAQSGRDNRGFGPGMMGGGFSIIFWIIIIGAAYYFFKEYNRRNDHRNVNYN